MHSVIQKVRVAGLCAGVPRNSYKTIDTPYRTREERQAFEKITGIKQRRLGERQLCTSDLGFAAAEKLLEELRWNKEEIALLVFITQSPDYPRPATAIVLQDRLGLPKSCTAFDINLGCSGFVIGLQIVSGLLSSMPGKKALLIVGDTLGRDTVKVAKIPPMFGDACTATALEWSENAAEIVIESGNDGAGFKSIICEFGGYRNRLTHEQIKTNQKGELQIDLKHHMDEHAVFNFTTGFIPGVFQQFLDNTKHLIDNIDYFVFHQANKQINELMRRKLKIPVEKFPYSIHDFGNTSSATVPLTITTQLRTVFEKDTPYTLLLCGFGIGLSWGTAIVSFENVCIPELVEI